MFFDRATARRSTTHTTHSAPTDKGVTAHGASSAKVQSGYHGELIWGMRRREERYAPHASSSHVRIAYDHAPTGDVKGTSAWNVSANMSIFHRKGLRQLKVANRNKANTPRARHRTAPVTYYQPLPHHGIQGVKGRPDWPETRTPWRSCRSKLEMLRGASEDLGESMRS